MKLDSELNVALSAIKQASKIVMDFYHDGFIVNIKKDKSEVTNADLASNALIRGMLCEAFPEYGILTEEDADNEIRLSKDYCWIVDPLDGTKDFVNRTDNFSINIALSYKGDIVLGVIAVPVRNIIYYAVKDCGAFKISEDGKTTQIHVSNKTSSYNMMISQFFFKRQDEFKSNPLIGQLIVCGSSYKAGQIAEGIGDLCVKDDPNSKEWDTAPSEIIIREAGGVMSDMYGDIKKYNKEDVINHTGFIIANSQDTLNKFKKNK